MELSAGYSSVESRLIVSVVVAMSSATSLVLPLFLVAMYTLEVFLPYVTSAFTSGRVLTIGDRRSKIQKGVSDEAA